MTKNIFILILALILTSKSFGQDLFVIVLKGNAFIEEKHLSINYKYAVEEGKNLVVNANSKVLVFNQSSYSEEQSGTFTYQQLKSILVKKLPLGLSKHLLTTHKLTHTNGHSLGSTKAGIKGIDDAKAKKLREANDYAIPTDSVRTLSKTITLEWKTAGKINKPKLIVTHIESSKILVEKAIEDQGTQLITLDDSGEYEWEIVSSFDNKIFTSNIFSKLTEEESKTEMTQLNEFKSSITIFDTETQNLLLNDYLEQNLLLLE